MSDWREQIEAMDERQLDIFRFGNTICMPGFTRNQVIDWSVSYCYSAAAILGDDEVQKLIDSALEY